MQGSWPGQQCYLGGPACRSAAQHSAAACCNPPRPSRCVPHTTAKHPVKSDVHRAQLNTHQLSHAEAARQLERVHGAQHAASMGVAEVTSMKASHRNRTNRPVHAAHGRCRVVQQSATQHRRQPVQYCCSPCSCTQPSHSRHTSATPLLTRGASRCPAWRWCRRTA